MASITLRDGTRLRYRKIGKGEPILLLHGFGLNAAHWQAFVTPLMNRYCFIIPDLRGHGGSYKFSFSQPHSPFEQFCEDIDELVRTLGLRTFGLAGYSMGAVIGLHYLIYYGQDKVDRYLHIEAGPKFHSDFDWSLGFNRDAIEKAQNLIGKYSGDFDTKSPLQHLPSEFISAYREFIWMLAQISWPPGVVQRFVRTMPDLLCHPWLPHWHVACSIFKYLLEQGYDLCGELRSIRIPITIMAARHSQFFPIDALHWMIDQLDRSKLIVFENSGHGLMYSEPLKFVWSIRGFLRQPSFAHSFEDVALSTA